MDMRRSRRWGWLGRTLWNDYCLGYFIICRNLVFVSSKAQLRVHVIRVEQAVAARAVRLQRREPH